MELEKMSNEELLKKLRNRSGSGSGFYNAVHGDEFEAEIMRRINHPTEYKNCGNCGWAEKINEHTTLLRCPKNPVLVCATVDSSTLCKEHKTKDNGNTD